MELQDATIRRLTIIGEVIKRSPEQFRQEHDEIAWRKAAGMRDVLIHNYDDVNTDQIWFTITQVIPPFKDQIVRLLEAI